jgi:hypothetical protein
MPAFCFNRVKEVRQDNVTTYHEMQYLEQLMDMVDTAKGTCARDVMLSRSSQDCAGIVRTVNATCNGELGGRLRRGCLRRSRCSQDAQWIRTSIPKSEYD